MKAAIFRGEGILSVENIPIPKVKQPDQVVIKVRAASICGTDLHALHVPPEQEIDKDIILGHEFFGDIVEKGDQADGFEIGDTVAVNPCLPCGMCWECKHNIRNLCMNPRHYGMTCDGGFSEYALVESSQLYHLPKDIDPEVAAQTEPLACVMYSLNMIKPTPAEHVLLYGAGPIGLTYIKALQAYGIKNFAIIAKGEKRIRQAEACGAAFVIDLEQGNIEEKLLARWGCLADVVIDAVGRGSVLTEGIHLINTRGRIMIFGLDYNAVSQVPPAVYARKELTMMGAMGKDFPAAIELIRQGIDLKSFVTHRVDLDGIHDAIDLLRSKEACRVIVYPQGL